MLASGLTQSSSGNTSRGLRVALLVGLAVLLAVGLFAFDDYGLGWDDRTSRGATAQVNWNFMTRGVSKPLLEGNEKYHGPAFELLLLAIEKALFVKDLRAVFLLRHLTMFLTFALAVVAFHGIALRVLARPWTALFAAASLVLSPRIFAESFVNSKDLAFLSFSILAAWSLFRALERPTIARIALHALLVAWLVDVRILGILHVPVTLGCFAVQALREGRASHLIWAARTAGFSVLTAGLVVLFWPVLWLGPWHHFRSALEEMSYYHWVGLVLYSGSRVMSTDLPWHYLPVWIFITTPLLYSALFFVGNPRQSVAVAGALTRPSSWIASLDLRWGAIAAYGFGPVLSVIALESVVYDGWRHVYCVYAFLVLFAARGLEFLVEAGRMHKLVAPSVLALVLLNGAWVAVETARTHPHQNVYFNEFARARWRPIGQHFELDYWGVAYRQGLEHVLALVPRPQLIRIAARNPACEINLSILEAADRERIEYVKSQADADWYLSNFRHINDDEPIDPPDELKVHEVTVSGEPILAIYRMKP